MSQLDALRSQYPELAGLDDEGTIDALQQAFYPDLPRETIASRLGYKPPAPAPEPSGALRRYVGDTGLSLMSGAIDLASVPVGLADMVTGGRAGKLAEEAGFRPREAQEFLAEHYSPEHKAALQEFQQAEGVMGKAAAALRNPGIVGQAVARSLPSMVGGAAAGRGLVTAVPRVGAVGGAAAGEGLMAAGAGAEQIRQQTPDGLLTGQQSAIAAASGAATGLLGVFGGKLAQSLGVKDVDTLLVGAARSEATRKGIVRKVVEGAVSEGFLEELPQSVQEQVAQNVALGKPLEEGVDEAMVLGTLSGAALGGGAQLLPGRGPLTRATNAGIESGSIPAGMPGVEPAMPPQAAPVNDSGADPAAAAALPPAVPPAMPGAVDPDTALARMERQVQVEQQDARGRSMAAARAEVPELERTQPMVARPEVVAEQPLDIEPDLDLPLPGDVLAPAGGPWKAAGAARKAMKANPGTAVAQVQGGYVLRPIKTEAPDVGLAVPPLDGTAASGGSGRADDGAGLGADGPGDVQPAGAVLGDGAAAGPADPDGLGRVGGDAAVAAPVAGAPIDAEWTAFAPESGTKAVPRAEMPQIKAEHRGPMVNFLAARGIAHESDVEVDPRTLKPTQAEFSPAKVAKAREFTGGDRSILVSADGHVLDGHHQWLAKLEAGEPVKVIRLDAPIEQLIGQVREFPSAEAAEGATTAQPIAEAPAAEAGALRGVPSDAPAASAPIADDQNQPQAPAAAAAPAPAEAAPVEARAAEEGDARAAGPAELSAAGGAEVQAGGVAQDGYDGPTMAEVNAIADIPTVEKMREAVSTVGDAEFERRVEARFKEMRPTTENQRAMLVEAEAINIVARNRRTAPAPAPAAEATPPAANDAPSSRPAELVALRKRLSVLHSLKRCLAA